MPKKKNTADTYTAHDTYTHLADPAHSRVVFESSSLAWQTLQGELRNSEAKGSGLERQVSQLSARMNRAGSSSVPPTGGGGGASSRSSGGGGAPGDGSSVPDSSGAWWEGGDSGGRKARGAEVTEAEIASLRRQMKAATQVSCCTCLFFTQLSISTALVVGNLGVRKLARASGADEKKRQLTQAYVRQGARTFCGSNAEPEKGREITEN